MKNSIVMTRCLTPSELSTLAIDLFYKTCLIDNSKSNRGIIEVLLFQLQRFFYNDFPWFTILNWIGAAETMKSQNPLNVGSGQAV
jgi:hypothetical protein